MYRDGTNPTMLTERLLASERGDDVNEEIQSPEEIRAKNVKCAILADALWTLADSIWAGACIGHRMGRPSRSLSLPKWDESS